MISWAGQGRRGIWRRGAGYEGWGMREGDVGKDWAGGARQKRRSIIAFEVWSWIHAAITVCALVSAGEIIQMSQTMNLIYEVIAGGPVAAHAIQSLQISHRPTLS